MQDHMDIELQDDFRSLVESHYQKRLNMTGSYSIRAFARHLDIDSSLLSKMLRGTRPFTPAIIKKTCERLDLDPYLAAKFTKPLLSDKRWQELSEEQTCEVSQWYHFAIISLLETEKAFPSIQKISKRLGISMDQTRSAIRILKRNSIIRENKSGELVFSPKFVSNSNLRHTSEQKMNLQRQFFELAARSIQKTDIEKRQHSGLTVAIDPDLIPELKVRIKEFCCEINDFIDKKKSKKKEVYQMSVGLFPLSEDI